MKKYIIKFILVSLPALAVFGYPMLQYAVGKCYGDMNNLGTPFFDTEYRSVFSYQPVRKQRVPITDDYQSQMQGKPSGKSVFIIGDSFSQQGSRSFSEYLSEYLSGWNVMTAKTMLNDAGEWQYVQTVPSGKKLVFPQMMDYVAYILTQMDTVPDILIVESEELGFFNRLMFANLSTTDKDYEEYNPDGPLHAAMTHQDQDIAEYEVTFSGSMSYAWQWLKRLVGMKSSNLTAHQTLDKPYFTCKGKEEDLYFLCHNAYEFGEEQVKASLSRKDSLVQMADERGVKLMFFICPSKLEMYSTHIKNVEDKYNKPSLFEMMHRLKLDNNIVDNRKVLLPYVDKGEKDLYFCNDTHWSHKAASITSRSLANKILSEAE